MNDSPRVTARQIAAFRLRAHHLQERGTLDRLPSIVSDMGGAQAQVISAAESSLWARTADLTTDDIARALWEDRSLARAWAMRRTLFLLPARDLAIFLRGSARRAEKELRWMRNRGVPGEELDRAIAATLDALDSPRTSDDLAREIADRNRGTVRRRPTGGGWGNRRPIPWVRLGSVNVPVGYLLHLAGARGDVCSGPGVGSRSTYVRADAWIPHYRSVSQSRAEGELLRRYLRSFGPARPEDFVAWTRVRLRDAREIWATIAPELVEVRTPARQAWLLREDVEDLLSDPPSDDETRLLPHFDSYLLGHDERAHLAEVQHHGRIYRAAGWVAPSVLDRGRVVGTWEHRAVRGRSTVQVRPFRPLGERIKREIRAEAGDFARFRGLEPGSVRFG